MNRLFKRAISWLFWINFLIFQWFFIRLGHKYNYSQKKFIRWEFIGFILPLTGWWNNYIWIWKINRGKLRNNKSLSKEDVLNA